MVERRAYLDHCATTPLRREVAEVYQDALASPAGDPAGLHASGRAARQALQEARCDLARGLGALPSEVVFTSGATEANHLAVLGGARAAACAGRPRRVVVSAVEHSTVLGAAAVLGEEGFEVVRLGVDGAGRVGPEALGRALEGGAALVSVMLVNHEVGVVQPVAALAALARGRGALYHTDAALALGRVPVAFGELGADLVSFSSHKVGGPRGVGVLLAREGVRPVPLWRGGDEERGLRPGARDVAGAVAFARAASLAVAEVEVEARRLAKLRDRLEAGLVERVRGVHLHGDRLRRAPHLASASFEGVEGEGLVLLLDDAGVEVTTGSACATLDHLPSHVLLAMGVPRGLAQASIRYSLGLGTTGGDIDRAVEGTAAAVARLRALSPIGGLA